MTEDKIVTIIASKEGVMREALKAVLVSFPSVEIAGLAGGGLSALKLVQERQAELLVIDNNLSEDEVLALLDQLKQRQPQPRCIVLVESTKQKQRMISKGADAALLRGSPTEYLREAVREIGDNPGRRKPG